MWSKGRRLVIEGEEWGGEKGVIKYCVYRQSLKWMMYMYNCVGSMVNTVEGMAEGMADWMDKGFLRGNAGSIISHKTGMCGPS